MLEYANIKEFISSFGYLAIFFGTIVDHSGIPFPIVLSGYFSATGIFDERLAIIISFIAVLTSNLASYFIGIYFSSIRFNNFKKYKNILRMIEISEGVIGKYKYWMILFSNFFAVWGKFVFFSIGRQNLKIRFFYFLVLMASLFYTVVYFFIGNKLYHLLQPNEDFYSRILILFSLFFFMTLYLLSLFVMRKNKS